MEKFPTLTQNGYDHVAHTYALSNLYTLQDLVAKAKHIADLTHPRNFVHGDGGPVGYIEYVEAEESAPDRAKNPDFGGLNGMGCIDHITRELELWRPDES